MDGCSGGVTWFYNSFLGRDIGCRYCCDEHDLAYEEGGCRADRRLADQRFRHCVAESGRPVRAWLFWAVVRVFGWIFWGGGMMHYAVFDWLVIRYNLARLTLAFSPGRARRLKRKALAALFLLCSLLAGAASLMCAARAACHG